MGVSVYAVFKTGIYRHECGGVYSTKEAAIGAADLLASIEPDDYHAFEVIPFEIDKAPDIVPDQHSYRHVEGREPRRMADEADPIYTVQAMGPVPPYRVVHLTTQAGAALCGSKWSSGRSADAVTPSTLADRRTCTACKDAHRREHPSPL